MICGFFKGPARGLDLMVRHWGPRANTRRLEPSRTSSTGCSCTRPGHAEIVSNRLSAGAHVTRSARPCDRADTDPGRGLKATPGTAARTRAAASRPAKVPQNRDGIANGSVSFCRPGKSRSSLAKKTALAAPDAERKSRSLTRFPVAVDAGGRARRGAEQTLSGDSAHNSASITTTGRGERRNEPFPGRSTSRASCWTSQRIGRKPTGAQGLPAAVTRTTLRQTSYDLYVWLGKAFS